MPECRTCCKCFTVSLVPVTVFSLALLFFAGIILLPTLYEELSYREQYGIVIDAGSTHTQVYLYSWKVYPNSVFGDTRRVYQMESCKAPGGGINDFMYNSTLILEGLHNCTKGVINEIPSSVRNDTDIWLGATAGMRIVALENPSLEQDILSNVTAVLNNFTTKNASVHVLSGQEEASSGWLTTNYLNFNFAQPYPKKSKRGAEQVTTVGALDMGGASMQIAFELVPGTKPPTNFSSVASIFNTTYVTYARSYLCYGVNEASRRLHAFLAKSQNYKEVLDDPCLLRGRNVTVGGSYLFANHTCTEDLAPSSSSQQYQDYTFSGTGNSSQCSHFVSQALNFSWCGNQECVENDTQPSVNNLAFYAFSNFFFITNFTNVSTVNATTIEEFFNIISNFCQLSWKEAQSKYSGTTSDNYLEEYCFRGVYVFYVLQDGLGFKKSSGWTIKFVYQVDGIDVGWSLGYMLNQTNQIAPSPNYYTSRPYTCVDLIVGMVILTILCVVFVVFFFFTFSACRKALRPSLTGYSNIG